MRALHPSINLSHHACHRRRWNRVVRPGRDQPLIGFRLLGSPVAAALAVPLILGVLLLVEGIALIIWAFRIRA